MAKITIALLHSPFTGPSVWTEVARFLAARGYEVVVPTTAAPGSVDEYAKGMAAGIAANQYALVGHSGAGALLPAVSSILARSPLGYVFVDAGLPRAGSLLASLPEEFSAHLMGLARNGLMPPWPTWFSADVMDSLISDPAKRAAVMAECPATPVSFFEEERQLAVPWPDAPVAILWFSPGYEGDAARAQELGWPVAHLEGGHLHIVLDPEAVGNAIAGFVANWS
jgi:hypothetical protein